MKNKSLIENIINESYAIKESLLQSDIVLRSIENVCKTIILAIQNDSRIWFCGNGGSASDAQHIAAELSGRFFIDRKAMKSEALHCNSSYLTAVANDYGYDKVYSRLVEGIMDPGDVLIGLSTSGSSRNILEAFKVAKSRRITTVLFTGNNKNALISEFSDITINIPSNSTPRIQEAHILVGHIVCEIVERVIYDSIQKR